GKGPSNRDLGSTTYGDFFVDTVWTNSVHNYAETRVRTRSFASDLLPRIARLTPFRSNQIRSAPRLVRNAEVGSSSLLRSTSLRSHAMRRLPAVAQSAKAGLIELVPSFGRQANLRSRSQAEVARRRVSRFEFFLFLF